MKRLLLILGLMCSLPIMADSTKLDSIRLTGKVVDSFTRETVDSVFVEVMMPDSTTRLDTAWNCKESWGKGGWATWVMEGFSAKLPHYGKYLLRCTKRGYKPAYMPLDIPRKRYNKRVTEWETDEILLKKSNSYDFDEDMKEVTITATRIKMFQNGDTVVYNADAFELSEGSMLDELIRQLPGVELKEGGQIYVNGNKVDELLLNGKHFFQGDAKVALENLPAYMVNNVKAYQRESDMAYLDKHHEEMKKKDPWVIDVNLKREYSIGWIGNAEGGYGTNNRYLGRLFLTRFSDHSRLTVYAGANNTNNMGRPGSEGSWSDWSTPTSEMDNISGGIDFHVDSRTKKTQFDTSLNASHTKTDSQTDASSTTFLTSGDVFNRSRNISESFSNSVSWNAGLQVPKKELYFHFSPNFNYSNSRSNGFSTAATFDADPKDSYRGESLDSLYAPLGSARLDSILTNRHRDLSKSTNKNLSAGLNMGLYLVSPINGEQVSIDFNGSYNHSENTNFSQYHLIQPKAENDYRNRYDLTPSHSVQFSTGISHNIWEFRNVGTIGFSYRYSYNYNKGRRSLYDLHKYDEWGEKAQRPIGLLPSTTDSLSACIDAKNSYRNITRDQTNNVGLNMSHGGEWGYYHVSVGLARHNNYIEDTRKENSSMHRRINLPQASWAVGIKDFSINMNYSQDAPSMSYLMDIRDDSDPLSISLGNANLKNSSNESFSLNYWHNNMECQRNWSISANAGLTQNSIGNALTYNRKTGVYTYQPRNINGNWNASANGGFGTPIDKNKWFEVTNNISLSYNRSVDFSTDISADSQSETEEVEPTRSMVHNYSAYDNLTLRFQKGGYRASLFTTANYRHMNSARAGFQTVNSVDLSYGASCSLKLPWSLQFDMDLTMHTRRGYSDKTMNEDNLVWNASLAKSFLKGKCLTVRIMGHDILQQLSSVQRTINGQGISETWYNTQPSYGLLTVAYKLNMKPKKQKDKEKSNDSTSAEP